MMRKRKKRIAMLALDIIMIAMEIGALLTSWMQSGPKLFRYYTQDSNILALVVSIICLVQNIACLKRGAGMPGWTRRLRYISACCLAVTLLVAGLLLSPMEDGGFASFMLKGKYLYLHTLCPIILIAQLFLHAGPRLGEVDALKALIPTIIYGVVSLMLNAAGAYSGPYPFLRIREQEGYVTAVGCIAVLGVSYFAARMLAVLTCIRSRKKERS